MGSKRFEKKKPGRLWTLSVNQARKTVQQLKVRGTNGYNNSNIRVDDADAMHKKWRTPLEEPSRTRVVRSPNDVARSSSSRLNNSKVSLQSDIENARPSTSRVNNGLGSRQKYTKKPMPSSSRPNNSSQKKRSFVSRSNNGSVSREKNVKKPQPFASTLNNNLVTPHEKAKKPMPFPSRPNNGGTSRSKNIEMSRPSPSRPNNNMTSSPKEFEKSGPSSSSRNGGSVPPLKNIMQLMSAKSRPSRLRGEFSSRKPTVVVSNDNSNSTSSISNKSPPSLVHGHSSNVEMSTQVQSEELLKANEVSTSSLTLKGNRVMHGPQPQTTKAACMSNNMEENAKSMNVHVQLDSRKQNTALVSDGKADDDKYRSKMTEPLLKEKLDSHVDDDSAKENSRPNKRMRKYIYEDDDADDNGSDQNLVGAESSIAVITKTAVLKDCPTEVSHHFVSESFKMQQYSSLPIDHPIWSGIIKTRSKEYAPLAAHLSTKYCDKVSKLSRSLPRMLEVTKLSRLEAWPRSFEASRPTDDNIALYFFLDKTRQDADLDQLVEEVVENDLVLRAVVDEAELLIFPSVLLPEQYQTFQGKPYLWGVFRPRQEKLDIVEEQHGKCHCAQEMGKQNVADCGVGKKGHMVAGLNVGVGLETPEEAEGHGMEQEQTPSVARPNTPIPVEDAARATSASTMPAGKEKFATVEEQHGIGYRGQEEMGKQDAADRGVGKKGHMVSGLNAAVGLETPDEAEGQGMDQEHNPSVARPNTPIPVEGAARATSAPTMPAGMSANNGQGATSAPTMPSAVSANNAQNHSSFSVPTGAIGFVARQTPRLELLIEDLQREGAIVVVMRGEMIGSGLGQATTQGREDP